MPIKANLRGKITEYGVYDKLKKSFISIENRLLNQGEYELLNVTNKIKAIKNKGFGFRYEIRKFSPYAENDFKLIIHHPPIVNEKGIRLNKTEWTKTLPGDYGIFESEFLYFFDHEYEMVSGIWKFQIIDRDKILLEKEFYVSF